MTKIALVTGANKGIGKEIARQLAKQGIHVIMGVRDHKRGQVAVDELSKEGLLVESIILDVTNDSSVAAAAKTIQDNHGKLDILVNNAGIAVWTPDPLQLDVKAFQTTYDTNVFGIVRVIGAMHTLLKASGAGRIVNMSTSLGSLGLVQKNSELMLLPAYNSSKTAVNALTVIYAKLLDADAIKVNVACPGFVDTDLNNHTGIRNVKEAAATPVRLALLDNSGPTGGFFDDNGSIEW
jgi:NAD(P)-dependent dehydrogenase (short-subunit alcohol dehydrogenase family)